MNKYIDSNNGEDGLMAGLVTLGESLSGWRDDAGYTLNELSELSGLSVGYLSALERPVAFQSIKTLFKLATAYQKTVTIDIGYLKRLTSEKDCE